MTKIFGYYLMLISMYGAVACNSSRNAVTSDRNLYSSPPKWILRGNIYEVNVRQYTPEGTFNAFAKHLDRLQDMGVQTLWFMPINPIGKLDRKGSLGSYYAVSDYTDVNREFGTMDDWLRLVADIHKRDMKVMIDWVPNHTAPDHRWIKSHEDFYVKDKNGKLVSPYDWTDVRKLNFANATLQDSMIAAMKFWVTQSNIDGFRVDHVEGVDPDFWVKCITELKRGKNVLMLAEGEASWMHRKGFDMSYPWKFFHTANDIAAGRRPATALDTINAMMDTMLTKKSLQMFFTSNHDENSWNKADYETMPGTVHAPFAVLMQTMDRSVPLIYSGQEEPVLRPIKFFDKDAIQWSAYKRANFYKTLLELRKRNEALSADATFRRINAGDEKAVYAYVREKEGKKVLVILNLSAKRQTINVQDQFLQGNATNVFMATIDNVTDKPWTMEPWGYVVYEY